MERIFPLFLFPQFLHPLLSFKHRYLWGAGRIVFVSTSRQPARNSQDCLFTFRRHLEFFISEDGNPPTVSAVHYCHPCTIDTAYTLDFNALITQTRSNRFRSSPSALPYYRASHAVLSKLPTESIKQFPQSPRFTRICKIGTPRRGRFIAWIHSQVGLRTTRGGRACSSWRRSSSGRSEEFQNE